LTGAFVFHALSPATRRPLINLKLFSNPTVALGSVTLFLIVSTFFGVELLLPSYFQQVLSQTPMQSGLRLIPLFVGGMAAMPIAGHVTDKHGPRVVVLAGISLFTTGMSVFTYGICQHYVYTPILLIALATMGAGMGCASMPVFAATVMSTLEPGDVARGSTLINVNQRMAGSTGAALASVILTGQLNRNANIATARQATQIRSPSGRLSEPTESVKAPLDFVGHITTDLSHAYAVVFVAAVCVVTLAFIPAAFLPRKSVRK
jgi:DHA2 family multidrug resistance protein